MFVKYKDKEYRIYWKHRNPDVNAPVFLGQGAAAGTDCIMLEHDPTKGEEWQDHFVGTSLLKGDDRYNRKIGIRQSFESLMRKIKDQEFRKELWTKFLETHKPLRKKK